MMIAEQAEIVEALSTCNIIPGSFDKRLIRFWNAKRLENMPLTDTGRRHVYRILYKYRKQIPDTYEKYQNHPEVEQFKK